MSVGESVIGAERENGRAGRSCAGREVAPRRPRANAGNGVCGRANLYRESDMPQTGPNNTYVMLTCTVSRLLLRPSTYGTTVELREQHIMPERIYTSTKDGKIEPLESAPFSAEKDLQELVASYPELLDGEQISPGDARRWILISREKGIAPSLGRSSVWAVDHLIVDQDAVPTLVEVKRGSSREIRRMIVSQMLEYAAHAAESWSADELRRAFKQQSIARKTDADTEVAALLDQEDDDEIVDRFWQSVATNLAAKRLRLLFVADEIPDELARTVEFLNAQMPDIEVLAIEIKRFHGLSAQTLVPRVIGRSSAALPRRQPQSRQRLTRESFLERFENKELRGLADRLLEASGQPNCYIYYGTGGVSIRVICPAWKRHLSVAWFYPPHATGWQRTKEFSFGAAIYDEDFPKILREKLDHWVAQNAKYEFAKDVSGKDTKAWAVSHEDAVRHQDILVERLSKIISELTELQSEISNSQ